MATEPPASLKWECWMMLVADNRYKEIPENHFDILVKAKNDEVDSIVKKDVPRTFSSKPFFGGDQL